MNIVFLPGFGFKSTIWAPVAHQLPDHQCQLLDLPDLSEAKINNHLLDTLAEKIADASIIVAWSLGGLIAMNLCHRYPNKCKKLITVASTPKFVASHSWAGISENNAVNFYKNAQTDINDLLKYFVRLTGHPNKSIQSQLQSHLINPTKKASSILNYLDVLLKTDNRHLYQQLKLPMLHIHGTHDAILPTSVISQFNVPKAGHALFLTHTSEFIRLLTTFIDS